MRHSSGGSLAPLVPHKTSPLIGHGSSIERVVTQNVHHGLSIKAFFYKSFLLQTSRDHLTQRHVIPAAVARGPSAHPPTRAELSSRDTSAMLSCRDMSAGPRGWAAAASREAPRCGPPPAVVQGFMPPRRAAAVTGRRHGSAAGRCRRTAAVTSRRHGSAAGGASPSRRLTTLRPPSRAGATAAVACRCDRRRRGPARRGAWARRRRGLARRGAWARRRRGPARRGAWACVAPAAGHDDVAPATLRPRRCARGGA